MSIAYVWKNRATGLFRTVSGQARFDKDLQAAEIEWPDADGYYGYDAVPVRVTEEPGPPIREVVELRGTVDHGSLIGYALWKPKYFWMHHCWTSDIAKAEFSRSIATLAQIVNSFPFSDDECEIVGIREVPGSTVRRIEEITE